MEDFDQKESGSMKVFNIMLHRTAAVVRGGKRSPSEASQVSCGVSLRIQAILSFGPIGSGTLPVQLVHYVHLPHSGSTVERPQAGS